MATGTNNSAFLIGVRNFAARFLFLSFERKVDISLRRALHWERPAAARLFNVGPVLTPSAARSRIWSPMATPPLGSSEVLRLLKTPNGRFWIGKSPARSLAESTQLLSLGSCVRFKAIP